MPGARMATGCLFAALLVTVPASGVAQQATLRGRVVDSEIGTPVSGAVIKIKNVPAMVRTDTLGQFEAPGLPVGKTEVTILAVGFDSATYTVYLPLQGVLEGVFTLDFTGFQLPEVAVVARVEQLVPRYLDFERRRLRGLGTYIRWDEIRNRGFSSVGDALRTLRGVRIQCNQETFECFAFMSRAPTCQPAWWIDGVQVRSFHENTPIRDVYGIEVYRGPGEVPAEFTGSTAGCGVIVMWTKSRPYR